MFKSLNHCVGSFAGVIGCFKLTSGVRKRLQSILEEIKDFCAGGGVVAGPSDQYLCQDNDSQSGPAAGPMEGGIQEAFFF